mgnify:CR=1 FL=1
MALFSYVSVNWRAVFWKNTWRHLVRFLLSYQSARINAHWLSQSCRCILSMQCAKLEFYLMVSSCPLHCCKDRDLVRTPRKTSLADLRLQFARITANHTPTGNHWPTSNLGQKITKMKVSEYGVRKHLWPSISWSDSHTQKSDSWAVYPYFIYSSSFPCTSIIIYATGSQCNGKFGIYALK